MDVMDLLFYWFENLDEPKNMRLDTMREFFSLKTAQAHEAYSDTLDTAKLLVQFLQFHRRQATVGKFKGAMVERMKTFACGCKFDVVNDHIVYNPNIEQLPLDCNDTWDLICEGNTKGVFQLESQLGRSMAERVKPHNMEQLSDLIAIIRPGCMEAIVDGKSLTNHYIDRKHKTDPVEYFHDSPKTYS